MEWLNDARFATLKRLASFVIGALVLVLNKKLGLNIDAETQALLVALIVGYQAQSAYKEAAVNKANAAASAVQSRTDALKVLTEVKSIPTGGPPVVKK